MDMPETIAPNSTVKFTITKAPRRAADRKTIQRLMQMQEGVRKTLKALQKQRRQKDNNTYIRAGVWWTDRAKATRPAKPEVGAEFTLQITPQIMPDIRSVEQFLDASPA